MTGFTMTIELPAALSHEVERLARERGVTPAEFAARAVADKVGAAVSAAEYFAARAKRADDEAFDRIMKRKGGEAPRAGDEAD
jgi:predicted transcriptional regulator